MAPFLAAAAAGLSGRLLPNELGFGATGSSSFGGVGFYNEIYLTSVKFPCKTKAKQKIPTGPSRMLIEFER